MAAASTLIQVSTLAERFTVPCATHGEGPFWDAESERLLLVDMLAGAVLTVDAEGGVQRYPVASVAAAIRARQSGGYVLAAEDRFVLLRPDLTVEQSHAVADRVEQALRRDPDIQLVHVHVEPHSAPAGRPPVGTAAADVGAPGAGGRGERGDRPLPPGDGGPSGTNDPPGDPTAPGGRSAARS